MSSASPLCIREGAMFVADVHYQESRRDFEQLIEKLENGGSRPPQLFLLGDIFDCLVGEVQASVEAEKQMITRLNRLSETLEIHYLEGNHDFNLTSLFPKIHVYSRSVQPLNCQIESGRKTVSLSHGDIASGWLHESYMSTIRNRQVLQCLDFIDRRVLASRVYHDLMRRLKQKWLCREIADFKEIAQYRIRTLGLKTDCLIEGHFHQSCCFSDLEVKYYGLGSFACKPMVFIVEFINNGVNLRSYRIEGV